MPLVIFSIFAAGWKSSASRKVQPSSCASIVPTVVLPAPVVPISRITIGTFYAPENRCRNLPQGQYKGRQKRQLRRPSPTPVKKDYISSPSCSAATALIEPKRPCEIGRASCRERV